MDISLGERELDVMEVLWAHGSGTVSEVRERLPADLAYTTVLTVLRNLEAKGIVRHEDEGKAHRYFPLVARQAARRSALARLVDRLFHGSAEALVAQLVHDRALDAGDLERLSRRVDELPGRAEVVPPPGDATSAAPGEARRHRPRRARRREDGA